MSGELLRSNCLFKVLEVINISASWLLLLTGDSEFVSRVFEDLYSCSRSLFITSSSLRDNSTVVLHDAFEGKKHNSMMLQFVGNERGVMWSTLLSGLWGGLY